MYLDDILRMQGYKVVFELKGKIQGKQRARYSPRSKRWYTPQETVDYEKRVADAFREAISKQILAQGYSVRIRRGQRIEVWISCVFNTFKHPDTDNVLKLVWDAVARVLQCSDNRFAGGVDYQYSDTDERLIVTVKF